MALSASLQHSFHLHQQGRLQEAFADYEQILAQQPTHAQALHFSGLVLRQAGRPDAAAQRIAQSLRVDIPLHLILGATWPWCIRR